MKLGFIGLGHMGAAMAVGGLATQDAGDRQSVITSSNSISN
jgi:3-hydroxyisobutyrate dehydrogenase-like beta-hydroxyacid dehydrogenase